MTSNKFLIWVNEFIKNKKTLNNTEIILIKEALDSININEEIFDDTKISDISFAGSTITYPQISWVSHMTYPQPLFKNPYNYEDI